MGYYNKTDGYRMCQEPTKKDQKVREITPFVPEK